MAKTNAPRRRRRWLLIIGGVIVVLGLSAAIAWWRLRVPRCEVEPLEKLGLDLADDDPVERLDRVREVVDTLHRSCERVSMETMFATGFAIPSELRHPPRRLWRATGSKRYGCADAGDGRTVDDDDMWRHCLELGGFPQELADGETYAPTPKALWTELMLEDLGVSRRAAQQLAWLLYMGDEISLWVPVARQQMHCPAVAAGLRRRLPEDMGEIENPTVIPLDEPHTRGSYPSFVIDRRVTVSRLHELEIRGSALFRVYSIAFGDAFPLDAWIPLRIEWVSLECDEAGCKVPYTTDEATAILDRGTLRRVATDRSAKATAAPYLAVPDAEATWDEIIAAAVAIAPPECTTTNEPPSACDRPWVTLWLGWP